MLTYRGKALANELKYSASVNFSAYKNLVSSAGVDFFTNTTRNSPVSRTVSGQSIGMFYGYVLDGLVQSRRNTRAAERLMRKLLRKHGKSPRVMVPDKLRSYAAANKKLGLNFEHRQHKGLNNRAENSHQPPRVREKVMRRDKSACQLQRFLSVHDLVANQFMGCRYSRDAIKKRELRVQAFAAWNGVTCAQMTAV